MRNWRLGVVGTIVGLLLTGCGESEEGYKGFKPTDTSQFDQMKEQMQKKFKEKSFNKVSTPSETKAETTK